MSAQHARPVAQLTELLAAAQGPALRALLRELADDDRPGVRDAMDAAESRERRRHRENRRLKSLYRLEDDLRAQGYVVVAGVDEVGRGALAGPLTAGACVLPADPRIPGLNDSKLLSPAKREDIALRVREIALSTSVAHIPASDVDSLGISLALRRVLNRAVEGLSLDADHVIVDGRPLGIFEPETAVIKGDSCVAAIAAASVLAKVTRDALMVRLAYHYPGYGFDVHKGYGTAEHLSAIEQMGLTPEHRRSFSPCGGTGRLF
jgi:ribonuclease HII